MKFRAFMAGLLVLAVSLLTIAARNSLSGVSPQDPQAAAVFTPDKGRLRILQNGAEMGTQQFELAPSGSTWIASGVTVIRIPGSGEMRSSGQLRLNADGTPVHYDWTAQTSTEISGTVEFENGTAKTPIKLEDKEPALQDFKFSSPRVVILDNNLYDQYGVLARLYDWKAKGTQTFPILIPQDVTPGTITVEAIGPRTIDGVEVEGLRVRSADLEIRVYVDTRHRLIRLEVPAANVVVVRD